MAKKQFFSIYLLREKYDATNAVKKESLDSIGEPIEAANLPKGGVMYAFESDPDVPWWIGYWGANVDFEKTSKGAVVFLPVNKRVFAFTFGTGFHHLDPSAFVYDFGLRVAMNSVKPEGILSTDSLAPENAQRQRTQMPGPSELAEFGFDGDRVVIKRMTGKVDKGIAKPFDLATGSESLKIGLSQSADQLIKTCKRLLTLYRKKDYQKTFPTLDKLRPVKEPKIVAELRKELCRRLSKHSDGIDLAVPDIIEYEMVAGCKFSGVGKSAIYEDVGILSYYDYLKSHPAMLKSKETEQLEKHRLLLVDELDDESEVVKHFPLLRCLICEIEKDGYVYHLSDGAWYRFHKGFVVKVRSELNKYFVPSTLKKYNHDNEGAYNQFIADDNSLFICLDKTNIAPTGSSSVEPCDLFTVQQGVAEFYHIKRHTRSATLSHLFNQGANSIELIKLEDESKDKMTALIEENIGANDKAAYTGALLGGEFKVVYGITTHKELRKKSSNLPLFSCISLRNAIHRLRLAGAEIECMLINEKKTKK